MGGGILADVSAFPQPKLYPNIARHIKNKHHQEIRVVKVLMMQKKSKERRQAWDSIIKEGDYYHNYEVLETKKGMLITKYRPRKEHSSDNYLPCEFCRGHYVLDDLWKHQTKCYERKGQMGNQWLMENYCNQPATSRSSKMSLIEWWMMRSKSLCRKTTEFWISEQNLFGNIVTYNSLVHLCNRK